MGKKTKNFAIIQKNNNNTVKSRDSLQKAAEKIIEIIFVLFAFYNFPFFSSYISYANEVIPPRRSRTNGVDDKYNYDGKNNVD